MAVSMLHNHSRPEPLSSSTPPPPLSFPRPVDQARSSSLQQGRDISRPSSASTTKSSAFQAPTFRQESIRLPGLAALAQAAEARSTPTPTPPPPSSASANGQSMSYATTAPGQGSVSGSAPPICQNCSTFTTPLWRRDDSGSVLCNACGLFLKLHNRPRPISLKTDVIKSRNRIKIPASSASNNYANGVHVSGDSASPQDQNVNGNGRPRATDGISLAAAHPSVASNPLHADRHLGYTPATAASRVEAPRTDHSSREATPGTSALLQYPHVQTANMGTTMNGNIAPQHLFDSINVESQQSNDSNGHRTTTPDLQSENGDLRTRVSELEVINDLFRGRVAELEAEVVELRRLTESSSANAAALKRGRDMVVDVEVNKEDEEGTKRRRLEDADCF